MDVLLLIDAGVLGIVEGLTEFLPVAARGHWVLAATLIGAARDPRLALLAAAALVGATAAVAGAVRPPWPPLARSAPRHRRRLAAVLALCCTPVALLEALAGPAIRRALSGGPVLAGALVAGALAILWAERRAADPRTRQGDLAELRWRDACALGLAQCLTLIPGTGRAGVAIVGGMLLGLSRRAAIGFSFVLAVPLLGLATLQAARDAWPAVVGLDVSAAVSAALACASAFAAGRASLRWLSEGLAVQGFVPFAWYRIAFGLVVTATWLTAMVRWGH